ncbi:MAG: type III secretion system export apparatus subunit SctS [Candidatus Margulisiibacteriota bacterium]|jgi:flagellar biosynthetic protein FliQ
MTIDIAKTIITKGVLIILFCSAPAVGCGLLIGFMISLFQAVTQIQEQTLTFVPKMITVLLVVAVTFPWMGSMLLSFTQDLWLGLPALSR